MKDFMSDFKSVDVSWEGKDNLVEMIASLAAVWINSFPGISLRPGIQINFEMM